MTRTTTTWLLATLILFAVGMIAPDATETLRIATDEVAVRTFGGICCFKYSTPECPSTCAPGAYRHIYVGNFSPYWESIDVLSSSACGTCQKASAIATGNPC